MPTYPFCRRSSTFRLRACSRDVSSRSRPAYRAAPSTIATRVYARSHSSAIGHTRSNPSATRARHLVGRYSMVGRWVRSARSAERFDSHSWKSALSEQSELERRKSIIEGNELSRCVSRSCDIERIASIVSGQLHIRRDDTHWSFGEKLMFVRLHKSLGSRSLKRSLRRTVFSMWKFKCW